MSPVLRLIFGVCVVLAGAVAVAADSVRDASIPIAELPPHTRFEDGKISFIADYANPLSNDEVAFYLVNATEAPLDLDFPFEIFREVLCEDGQWRRCDSYIVRPHCDVGVPSKFRIDAHSFFMTPRRSHSAKGEMRTVRFRHYLGLIQPTHYISNEGAGRVDLEGISSALVDLVGRQSSRIEDLIPLTLGEASAGNPRSLQLKAISLLREPRFATDRRRIPLLRQLFARAKQQNDLELYTRVLTVLRIPDSRGWTEKSYMRLAMEDYTAGKQPWAAAALESMLGGPFAPESE